MTGGSRRRRVTSKETPSGLRVRVRVRNPQAQFLSPSYPQAAECLFSLFHNKLLNHLVCCGDAWAPHVSYHLNNSSSNNALL